MVFRANIQKSTGEDISIIENVNLRYTDNLNEINKAMVNLIATDTETRAFITVGNKINIYRNDVLEFAGNILDVSYFDGGGVAIKCWGAEEEMTRETPTWTTEKFQAIASETIINQILTDFDATVIGTIDTGISIDFRVTENTNVWSALKKIVKATGQEIEIVYQDYTNTNQYTVNIVNLKGTQTSVDTLNDGIEAYNMQVQKGIPIGNKVLVYGQGDGVNQIRSEYPTAGQDAASQATFGVVEYIHNDGNIISTTQANEIADKLVTRLGGESKQYVFEVVDTSKTYVSGDVITLNSDTKDVDAEEVAIVGIQKGINGDKEFLSLQVASTSNRILQLLEDRALTEIRTENTENQTKAQNTTNMIKWSEQGNHTRNNRLIIPFYLKASDMYDDAGNLNINSFELDFEVTPAENPAILSGSAAVGGSTSVEQNSIIDSFSSQFDVVGGGNSFTSINIGNLAQPHSRSKFRIHINRRWQNNNDWNNARGSFDVILTNTTTATVVATYNGVCSGSENWTQDVTVAGDIGGQTFQLDVADNQSGTTAGNSYHIELHYCGETTHDHLGTGTLSADLTTGIITDDDGNAGAIAGNTFTWIVTDPTGIPKILGNGALTAGTISIHNEIDISNGGLLPDALGQWYVQIYTENSGAVVTDYIKGSVTIKHKLTSS